MKILFCDNTIQQFLNFRGHIAQHFHDLGWETGVVVPESTCDDTIMDKVPSYLAVYPVDMDRNSSNPFSDIVYFNALLCIFKKTRPDIVFLYTIKPNIYGSIAAHLLNIKVVAVVAGLGYSFAGNTLKHKLVRLLYKFGVKKADKVIVLNESNYATLLDNGFATRDNLILFNGGEGVDLNEYPLVKDDYSQVRFLMVSRVLYDKGYTEYVDAAKIVRQHYPDIKIELLGPLDEASPMRVPSEIMMKDHDSGFITYLGETDDVTQYVGRDGTIVVISSHHEGCNRSLMEACAMGRICIASNIPGCKELVEDNVNGYLSKIKDPHDLAACMLKVIADSPEKRREMARNSHLKAKNIFDIHFVIKKYDEIIDLLIDKGSCHNKR